MAENQSPGAGPSSGRLPVLFIGHGSPMNALADTPFTRKLAELGKTLPRPLAILCVSAHWMSEGSWVTSMSHPKTIHDFYGFPQALFEVQYPAPGSPATAERIRDLVTRPGIHLDHEFWGLDHGAWSILHHMYPAADIPVLQLSVYIEQPPEYHFALGEQLRQLREHGILVVGSGNIVHNLRLMNWADDAQPYDWAVEFDAWVKDRIAARDYPSLLTRALDSAAGKLSVPAPDHWYPLFYTLGASDSTDALRFEYEGIDNSSISMRALSLGFAQ